MPEADAPADAPFSSIAGVPAGVDCVVPSMTMVLTIPGSGVNGWMDWTPDPGIAKVMVAGDPRSLLPSSIACRNDPGPLSAVVVTTRTRATGVTVIVDDAELFNRFGSGFDAATEAVESQAPTAVALAATVTVALPTGASVSSRQSTLPAAMLHTP